MTITALLLFLASAAPREVVVWEPLHAESFERGVASDVRAACGDVAALAASALALRDVTSCEVDTYRPLGTQSAARLSIVTLGYGPVSDCEAGCVQDSASAIVQGASVVAVPPTLVHLQSPYGYVAEYLRAALTERGFAVADPSGRWFDFFMREGFCANRHERVHLVTSGSDVYWRLEIPPIECTPHISGGSDGAKPWRPYSVSMKGELRLPVLGMGLRGVYPRADGALIDLQVAEAPAF